MHIRDGLTTTMKYAVVSSRSDFGPVEQQHGKDREFWLMRKPPFEAYKIVEVLQQWGSTVYPVGDVASVAGQPCYPTLLSLPEPVDCAVISLPGDKALRLVDEVLKANIAVVWLQYGASRDNVQQAYTSRGIRVVVGCVLLHWDIDHVSGIAKGRHICHMHGNLERAVRIRVDDQGRTHRIEPVLPENLPLNKETFGTILLVPIWPRKEDKS